MGFSKDFVWGAATASYQIEGAAYEGGKGEHIWDVACKQGRNIFDGHTAESGCDHYHRFREDVALMKEMGLKAYRFSLCWTRLMPEGRGELNPDGVRFYNELIDELLGAGIEPYITLFHWDYPYKLYLQGGWLNPDSPVWFAEYAAKVAELFSDRVSHFITVNEPQCFIGLGLYRGEHAPFLKLSPEEALLAWHNTLKANGLAVRALRAHGKQPLQIGIAVANDILMPCASEDAALAEKENFIPRSDNFFTNSLFTDPIVFGRYPEGMAEAFGARFSYDPADMDIIKCDIDFIGLNIYHGAYVKADGKGGVTRVTPGMNTPHTDMRWTVSPESLYYGPTAYFKRYGLPIYITENGVAVTEWPSSDGGVHDAARIEYVRSYLHQLKRASEDGADIRGYFYWSLMDNFEWAEGFSKRFGLIYVDYDTKKRTPKDSARAYSEIIATNGETL